MLSLVSRSTKRVIRHARLRARFRYPPRSTSVVGKLLQCSCPARLIQHTAKQESLTTFNDPSDVINPRGYDNSWVSDAAQVLDAGQVEAINKAISDSYESLGIEVAVAILQDVQNMSPEAAKRSNGLRLFARELFNLWGVGDAKRHNGILFLLAIEQRRFEIITGRSMAYVLTRHWLEDMQYQHSVPLFKQGKYGEGVQVAVFKSLEEIRNTTPDKLKKVSTRTQGGSGGGFSGGKASSSRSSNGHWKVLWPVVLFAPLFYWYHRRKRKCRCGATLKRVRPIDEMDIEETNIVRLKGYSDVKLPDCACAEIQAGTVRYSLWTCEACHSSQVIESTSGGKACDLCGCRTMRCLTTATIKPATTERCGVANQRCECLNRLCKFGWRDSEVAISKLPSRGERPRYSQTSSASSTFGGGSSTGSGGGSSW